MEREPADCIGRTTWVRCRTPLPAAMPFFALVAQLRYNAERLNALPVPVQSQADQKAVREVLASTLDSLNQLYLAQLAQPRPRRLWESPLYRQWHQLRAVERDLLAVSPGQPAPPMIWANLQQVLATVLVMVTTTY